VLSNVRHDALRKSGLICHEQPLVSTLPIAEVRHRVTMGA
jgi:hypothetical protein